MKKGAYFDSLGIVYKIRLLPVIEEQRNILA